MEWYGTEPIELCWYFWLSYGHVFTVQRQTMNSLVK
jgi:hypothetical protein